MSLKLQPFNFNNVDAVWGGVDFFDFDDGDAIVISPAAGITETVVSADSIANVSIVTNFTGTVTVNLQAMSPTNLVLSQMVGDLRNGEDLQVANFVIKDPTGIIPCIAKNAYLEMAPDSLAVGSNLDGKIRSWVFRCEELIWTYETDGLSADVLVTYQDEIDGVRAIFKAFI